MPHPRFQKTLRRLDAVRFDQEPADLTAGCANEDTRAPVGPVESQEGQTGRVQLCRTEIEILTSTMGAPNLDACDAVALGLVACVSALELLDETHAVPPHSKWMRRFANHRILKVAESFVLERALQGLRCPVRVIRLNDKLSRL